MPPASWGVSTSVNDLVYLHVLQDDLRAIGVEWPTGLEVHAARSLRTGEPLDAHLDDGVLTVRLPDRPTDLVDEIVIIETSTE